MEYKLEREEGEEILTAATRINGIVCVAPRPGRHHTIIQNLSEAFNVRQPRNFRDQGFLTTTGRFVNRREAMAIALDTGQVKPENLRGQSLYSEDIY